MKLYTTSEINKMRKAIENYGFLHQSQWVPHERAIEVEAKLQTYMKAGVDAEEFCEEMRRASEPKVMDILPGSDGHDYILLEAGEDLDSEGSAIRESGGVAFMDSNGLYVTPIGLIPKGAKFWARILPVKKGGSVQ